MPLSEKRIEEIRNFVDTDYSDCPPLTDEQLAQLQPCHLVKLRAESETVQLDSDVVEKIKKSGSGWQKKLNDFLRKSLASGLL